MSKILKILTLLNLPNIGNIKARKLLPELEDGIDMQALQLTLKTLVNIELSIERIQQAHSNALSIIEGCQNNNMNILTGESIPNRLARFNDTPLIFYVRGNQALLDEKIVAIIGSRAPTKKGVEAADKVSKFIVQTNHIILSGLALGVDSIAHQTAVNNKKPTIAVLGSGLTNIYPKENIRLAEQIVDYGGCLISAYSPNMSVQNYQLTKNLKQWHPKQKLNQMHQKDQARWWEKRRRKKNQHFNSFALVSRCSRVVVHTQILLDDLRSHTKHTQ